MTTKIRRCVLAVGLCAALSLGTQANAQQAQPTIVVLGNAYGGLSAGVIIPEDVHFSLNTAGISGSGNLSFKVGPTVSVYGGYHFNDYVAGELETGYARFDTDKLSLSGTVGTISGTATVGVGGHVDMALGFANVIVNPLTTQSRFSPYIGGGPGFAYFDATVDSLSAGGVTVFGHAEHSETDFAANAVAGLDYAVANGVSLGAQYRFLWINLGNLISGLNNGNFTAHLITANATIHF